MKHTLLFLALLVGANVHAQDRMTPELLWRLKRVHAEGMSADHNMVYYAATTYNVKTQKSKTHHYSINLDNGTRTNCDRTDGKSIIQREKNVWYATDDHALYESKNMGKSWQQIADGLEGADIVKVSPNGEYIVYTKEVMVTLVLGKDIYPDMPQTTAKIYTDLAYRHWDRWADGKYSHLFIKSLKDGSTKDIMKDEPYHCPQRPFGGGEDFIWRPDSKGVIYVCKKKAGKEYALSTNTDLYSYNIKTGNTTDITAGMMGYDTQPQFSPDGKQLAWTGMKHDGYESDKNDIYVMDMGTGDSWKINMTKDWDGTVDGFTWDKSGNKIYFTAPWHATEQLFSVKVGHKLSPGMSPDVKRVTTGKFDVNGIVGQSGNSMIVSRCDMNHASELYSVKLRNGDMDAITHENDKAYHSIQLSKTVLRMVYTTDSQKMGVWIIYPPNFDPHKKYPTLLYCQGGPQAPLSQFYSFRWNFQLMAANGYIIVAPNRRGMPGWGVKWNEEISKDWGGQPMRDYLTAIDDMSKEPYVDKNRLGCVGASYGGYSVYMLAGISNGRFKTFIAHDGLFDLKSWYGTTEELWFPNYDIGGPYWGSHPPKGYKLFNPSNYVSRWNTPIMIVQGGIDYRVPVEQGLEAFQAAQLRGIKSKLLYFPNEDHWVLHPQNAIVWQREFFKWLRETLK